MNSVAALQPFMSKLKRVLEGAPPPEPSSAAINLVIGVGNFQVSSLVSPHAKSAIKHAVSKASNLLSDFKQNQLHVLICTIANTDSFCGSAPAPATCPCPCPCP